MQQHQASGLDLQLSAGSAYNQVKQLYERNSTQARSFTYYSFILSAIALLFIAAGVIFAFWQSSTIGILTGVIVAIAGIMTQVLATLFLRATRDLNHEQDEMVGKLVDIEKYSKAIDIVLELKKDDVRDDLIEKILLELLEVKPDKETKDMYRSNRGISLNKEGDKV
jgi:hypothetical protein